MTSIMRSCYEPYDAWVVRDAAIEAPKVRTREKQPGQRGLFATDVIYPGERILFIPSTALIGEDSLRKRGSDLLLRGQADSEEDRIICMIEELRRMVADGEDSHEWRGDDTVALFLVACRNILQGMQKQQQVLEEQNEEEPQQQEVIAQVVAHADNEFPIADLAEIVEGEAPAGETTETTAEPTIPSTPQMPHHYPSFLPHVEMLPEAFPTNPLFWRNDELARIDGTNCQGFVTRMLAQIEADWSQLQGMLHVYYQTTPRQFKCQNCRQLGKEEDCTCRVLDPEADFTLDAYKWALSNIYSRSTDFEWTAAEELPSHRRVIAPLFDMMNHDFNSDVTHEMDAEGNVSVFNGASQTIQPETEICLNYGNFPNEKFLLVYGFVVPRNPFDAVQVYAPIPQTDPLYQVKERILLSKCGISDSNAPHALTRTYSNNILPSSLLSVLRLVGIQTTEELLDLASQQVAHSDEITIISTENEEAALSALAGALHSMARGIALNLISDDSLQGASNLSPKPPRRLDAQPLGPLPSIEEEEGAGMPTPKQQRALAAAEEELERGGPNMRNAMVLCKSEYQILQAALSEIADRLERLNPTITGQ